MGQKVQKQNFVELEIHPSRLRSTVRFSPEEYRIIQKDSNTFNKSIPKLLKINYFQRLPTTLFMSPENTKKFLRLYSGVANNLNQLTKRAHLGFSIPEKAIQEFIESNNRILSWVGSLDGNGQN